MATLGQIISRMRAAGESQEDIDATRAEYERINTPKPRPSVFSNPTAGLELPRGNPEPVEPTDFWGGVKGALTPGGGAFENAVGAIPGYLKGAIVNLPRALGNFARDALEYQVNPGMTAYRMGEGLRQLPGHIAETAKMSATQPFPWGELMGELTGQPIVTEAAGAGALAAARGLRPPVANLMSSVGRGLEGAKPVQGMPVTPKGAISSVIRGSVAPAGRALQRGGEALRKQAFAYEGARAAEGAGIPLKDPIPTTPEGEPMGGGMGITRPRVTRQGPGPTGIDPRFLGGATETAGEAAARSSGQPYRYPPDSVGNEIDPMFKDPILEDPNAMAARKPISPPPTIPAEPPPSQVAPGSQPPVVETAGDVTTRNRYQNRSMYPDRIPPEPQPSAFEQPVPSEADPMFQSDLETFETNPGGTSNVNTAPPSTSPGEPVPISDVDPMFRSEPTPPPGANLVKPSALTPEEEFAAAVEQARAELNQEPSVGFQPDPFSLGEPAPPTQPRVTVKAPKTPRDYEGLSLEELEAELAARKAGKKPAPKKAPEAEPEPPKAEDSARRQRVIDVLTKMKAEAAGRSIVEEGGLKVDTTTGEIIEPPRRGGSPEYGTPETPAVEPDEFTRELPIDEPPPTRSALSGDDPGFWGDVEGSKAVPEWADRVAEFLTRKRGPSANRGMFENSARLATEEAAATRPKSQFSDAVAGANEFSPDLVEGSENVLEGASPTFKPREAAPPEPKPQSRLRRLYENEEGSIPPRGEKPFNPRDFGPEAEARRDKVIDQKFGLTEGPVGEPARTGVRRLISELKKQIGNETYEHLDADWRKTFGDIRTEHTAQTLDDVAKHLDKQGDYGVPGQRAESTKVAAEFRKLAEEGRANPSLDFIARLKKLFLEDERGAIGLDIGPEGKGPKKAAEAKAAGKEATGNLAGRLVKAGDMVRVKAKDVGPRGGAYRVEDPSGKHLGDIVVTPKEIAEAKAHEGGILADVDDNLIAQEMYKNKFAEMMEKHGIREDAFTRVKVTTKSNRTKNVEDATAPPKPKAKATKEEPESKVLPPETPNKSFLEPIAIPASYEGMPRRYEIHDPTNHNAIQEGRRKGYHATYNEEGKLIMVRGDLITSEKMAAVPETAKAEPAPVRASEERTGLDPDKAFAPGGDPEPIREAIFQLRSVRAADSRYRYLLPSNKQGPLASGETWQGRVVRMFTEPSPAEVAKKAQVEEFIKSVEATREPQPRPVEGKVEQVPLLRSKDVKFTPRPVKPVRNSPAAGNKNWISPRQEEMLRQMRKKHGD